MSFTVWVFGDLPLDRACGPSYMVRSWARELGHLGVRARLFVPSGTWREHARAPELVTFRTLRHAGYRGDFCAQFSTLAQLRRARYELPDVILVATPGRVGVLGITLAARYSIPLVLVVSTDTIGAVRYYGAARLAASGGLKPMALLWAAPKVRAALRRRRPPDRSGGWGARLAGRCADALLAQADQLVLLSTKSVPEYGTDIGPRTWVIPAGIDRLPATAPPDELRWRPGALRVLYVGRFAPEKSLPLLVQALGIAVAQGIDMHLVLVGEGPLAGDLVAMAERWGVADRLTTLGPYARAELGGVYASADVFAFPSVIETQAFVLNEAAHEGLPLLVSDPEVNPVVCDGDSALVVAHRAQAYADGLEKLLDEQLRARLGAEARRRAGDLLEAAQTQRLAAVLRDAVGQRGSGQVGRYAGSVTGYTPRR